MTFVRAHPVGPGAHVHRFFLVALLTTLVLLLLAGAMIVTAFKPVAWRGLIEPALWGVAISVVAAAMLEGAVVARHAEKRPTARM
jgi:hypothetical protein